MAQQTLNDSESGLIIRGKINDNFTEVYQAASDAQTAADAAQGTANAAGSAAAAHAARTDNPHSVTATQTGAYTSGQVDTLLAAKQNEVQAIVSKTDSYSLLLSDFAVLPALMTFNKATALSVTIPTNTTQAIEVGRYIDIQRTGAGALTFAPADGTVTITGSAGNLVDAGLNVIMRLTKTGTNTWDLQNGAPGAWLSWTPTFAGFSTDPVVVSRYQVVGKTCFWWIVATSHGTSNNTSATSKTMTMPFTSGSAGTQQALGLRITNTTALTASGLWAIPASSNVMTIYKDGSAAATWTAGNCSWSGCGFYEIA